MRAYSLTHLSDGRLMQALSDLVIRERRTTAELLAHIAEVDERRLYVPAGYPSMYEYCVRGLKLSNQAALKRIGVARMARRVPALFSAIDEGRLHLSGALLLRPYLTPENSADLLGAVADRTVSEIEVVIATQFPKSDVPTSIVPVVLGNLETQLSSRIVAGNMNGSQLPSTRNHAPAPEPGPDSVDRGRRLDAGCSVDAPGTSASAVETTCSLANEPARHARLKPLSPERYVLQVTIATSTREKLARARELLSHRLPSGDLAQVLDLALEALVEKLEKQKFAATRKPRANRARRSSDARSIPAHVKREVWKRDQGRCTFVGPMGVRCGSRSFLEFDHVTPVAKGGRTCAQNLRLRCRAHNQYAAELAYGAGFMHMRRERSRACVAP